MKTIIKSLKIDFKELENIIENRKDVVETSGNKSYPVYYPFLRKGEVVISDVQKEKIYLLIALLLIKQVHTVSDYDSHKYFELHSSTLSSFYGKYKPFLRLLIDAKIIDVRRRVNKGTYMPEGNGSYAPNMFSKGYRFNRTAMHRAIIDVELKSFPHKKKWHKMKHVFFLDDQNKKHSKHSIHQAEVIKSLWFDMEQMKSSQLKLLNYNNRKWNYYTVKAHMFNISKEMGWNLVDDQGRIYCLLTNIPSDTLRYLRGDRFMQIDLKNSQAQFFSNFLQLTGDNSSDVQQFIELCRSGKLYDHLIEILPEANQNKKVFKKQFFKEIFYGTSKNHSFDFKKKINIKKELWLKFQDLYPNVSEHIRNEKTEHYSDFSKKMQKIEADFMIGEFYDTIISKYKDSKVIFIKHDGIICSVSIYEEVYDLFKKMYKEKFGYEPACHVDPLNFFKKSSCNQRSPVTHQIIPEEQTSSISVEPVKRCEVQEAILHVGGSNGETKSEEINLTSKITKTIDRQVSDDIADKWHPKLIKALNKRFGDDIKYLSQKDKIWITVNWKEILAKCN